MLPKILLLHRLFFLGFCALAGTAHASSASSDFPVFWVAGDPNMTAVGFKFVSAMFGNGSTGSSIMMGALAAATMMGLVIAIVSSAIRSQFLVGQWFVGTVIAMAMFLPTTSITVMSFFDDSGATVSPRMVVVDNVPIGVAYPAGMASFATKKVSDKFMEWFAVDSNGNAYDAAGGLMNPLRMLLKLQTMYDCSANYGLTCANYVEYVSTCQVADRVAEAWKVDDGLNQLLNDPDIGGYVAYKRFNPAKTVTIEDDGTRFDTIFMPCKQAGPLIYAQMTSYLTGDLFKSDIARSMPISAPESATTGISRTDLDAAGTKMENTLLKMQSALSGSAAVNNDIVANMVFHKVAIAGNAAINAKDSRHAAEMFVATMESSRAKAVTDQAIQGSMFVSFMTQAMNLFSFFFAATAPIIILVAAVMGMGGLKIYGSWLLFGTWSQSWLPIASIVSYYTETSFWGRLQDLRLTGQLSLSHMDAFYAEIANVLYTGSTMMSSVPIITFALLSGSAFAMTSLASKGTGTDRDYGDEKRLATDPYAASNADAIEKTALSGGGVFSSSTPPGSRLKEMDMKAGVVLKGANSGDIQNANSIAASRSVDFHKKQLAAAKASAAAVEKAALGRAASDANGSTAGDSLGNKQNAENAIQRGNTTQFANKVSVAGAIGTPPGAPIKLGAQGESSIANVKDEKESGTKVKGSGYGQDQKSSIGSDNKIDISKDQNVVKAREKVHAEEAALAKAIKLEEQVKQDSKRVQSTGTDWSVSTGDAVVNGMNNGMTGHLKNQIMSEASDTGGYRSAETLDRMVKAEGGWESQKAVKNALDKALQSEDQELRRAAMGATAALLDNAGMSGAANGVRTQTELMTRQDNIAQLGHANTLNKVAAAGDLTQADARQAGIGTTPNMPSMPSAPAMPTGTALPGTTTPNAEWEAKTRSYYFGQEPGKVANSPRHQGEVARARKIVEMGYDLTSPVGQEMLKNPEKIDALREHQKQLLADAQHNANDHKYPK